MKQPHLAHYVHDQAKMEQVAPLFLRKLEGQQPKLITLQDCHSDTRVYHEIGYCMIQSSKHIFRIIKIIPLKTSKQSLSLQIGNAHR